MARLHIFYNYSEGKSELEKNLQVKIDDELEFEVEKLKEAAVVLEDGTHDVTMFVPYMGDNIFGKTTETIEVQGEDLYYSYKAPMVYSQKGKFTKASGPEDFQGITKKNKTWSTIGMIAAIIVIILWLFFF